MSIKEINQFNNVCRILLGNKDITEVQDTDRSVKVFINDVGVVIDKNRSASQSYKTLANFLNLVRSHR